MKRRTISLLTIAALSVVFSLGALYPAQRALAGDVVGSTAPNPSNIAVGGTTRIDVTFLDDTGTAVPTMISASVGSPNNFLFAGATAALAGAPGTGCSAPMTGIGTGFLTLQDALCDANSSSELYVWSLTLTCTAANATPTPISLLSGNSVSATVLARCTANAPTLTKSFTPGSIAFGQNSRMRFDLANPQATTTLTSVTFSDDLAVAGLQVANPANLSTTCVLGFPVFSGAGLFSTNIAVFGIILDLQGTAGGTCNIQIDVTSAIAGAHVNTTGAISSLQSGTGATATATLTVTPPPTPPPSAPNETTRVNLRPDGSQTTTGNSFDATISGNGAIVAFMSFATDLVPGVTGTQVFARNRLLGITEAISRSTVGTAGNGVSGSPTVSADGRFVAFSSDADNLLGPGGDTNGVADIFLRDRLLFTTTRVSVANDGSQANGASRFASISADGRYVAFESSATNLIGAGNDTNGFDDIFVRDTLASTTTLLSRGPGSVQGNGSSSLASISADGQVVTFTSLAGNLLAPGVDSNGVADVFVRAAGVTTRVSVGTGSVQGDGASVAPAISADGRYVAFESRATNLLGPGADTNGQTDVYLHDRVTSTTTRVSLAADGSQALGGPTERASLSYDGRFVGFRSLAGNLVSGDSGRWDYFVKDTVSGRVDVASSSSSGVLGNDQSDEITSNGHHLSDDGRFVVFNSIATNLVAGDTNGLRDIFLKQRPADAAPAPPPGGAILSSPAPAGSRVLSVLDSSGFQIGDRIVINLGGANQEIGQIVGFGSIILQDPLKFLHLTGETIAKLGAKGTLPPILGPLAQPGPPAPPLPGPPTHKGN